MAIRARLVCRKINGLVAPDDVSNRRRGSMACVSLSERTKDFLTLIVVDAISGAATAILAPLDRVQICSNAAHQGEGDDMKIAMEPLLYAAGVFAGHVHAYERSLWSCPHSDWRWREHRRISTQYWDYLTGTRSPSLSGQSSRRPALAMPSNVSLDSEFEPRLADYGLVTTFPGFDRASSGFNPPECFKNSRYTDKSSIYSFGMLLGVLLTGRDPNDTSFGSMGEWLRQMQQGEDREALNKNILVGQQGEQDEMLMVLRIVVVSLSDGPTC
ncbi:Inactive leucine-rich repeat receptor-like protein kinase CORYNE [Striga hermonthica]|uniref:Inactive leucine-rich repeat receptor-like protein kinase CORYNE n=1 Tax=Striga hermonthica TaxID=68872 RepID=A0A9N7RKH2_STRHE|nr:Inactive leucine-rich repeat receptor-like protein kinase CORYNE [Striga hermonthica]